LRDNFQRTPGVMPGGHLDQDPRRRGVVTGEPRALLGDGLFRVLPQDLLPFFQQIADRRQPPRLVMAASPHGTSSRTASAATIASPVSTLRLLIAGGAGRGTMLSASAFQPFALGFSFFLNRVQRFVVVFTFLAYAKHIMTLL